MNINMTLICFSPYKFSENGLIWSFKNSHSFSKRLVMILVSRSIRVNLLIQASLLWLLKVRYCLHKSIMIVSLNRKFIICHLKKDKFHSLLILIPIGNRFSQKIKMFKNRGDLKTCRYSFKRMIF